MKSFNKITTKHEIGIGISPQKADLAIVSIDHRGTPGRLNNLVLTEYGYSAKDLPQRNDLEAGFSSIPSSDGRKDILFVVTVNGRSTSENLEKNLYNTLAEYRGWYSGKRVWIPLMGTGTGGLEPRESYSITVDAINKALKDYPTDVTFVVSLPDDEGGRQLFNDLQTFRPDQYEHAKSFLSRFNCTFYLVGSFWGPGNDQIERFIEQSFWEKGHDDETYSSIINEVKEGDILIAKSTYPRDGISYLKIKAVGVVLANPLNGAQLIVDWRIKGLWLDVMYLGHYRNTIAEADPNDVISIFSNIDSGLWGQVLPGTASSSSSSISSSSSSSTTATTTTAPPVPLPTRNSGNRLAGLISDTEKGTDYLDISQDVTAFARVIAAKSFDPPLAIALLGKWGSGKSFFMRKLKDQVTAFSNLGENGIYCKGVAHIHFNAWSYMDANLWASIVSKIFEELYGYISRHSRSERAKKEIEQELSDKLVIKKEEIEDLVTRKESVKGQISALEDKKEQLNRAQEAKIRDVRLKTLWEAIKTADQEFNAREKIIKAFEENPTYLQTEAELKEIIPEKYWSNPEATYQQIKSKYTFLREFFRSSGCWKNLIWLTIILVIICITPPLLELAAVQIGRINFFIPQATLSVLAAAGILWRRAETVYNRLKPVIASFWTVKEDYEKQVKETTYKFEQEEKVLKLEIEKGKAEMAIIDEQIQKAETIKADIEFRINHAIATESLYSFIDKRSKSEDYRKHLGIISIIRKDFETLSGLFAAHHDEVDRATKELKRKFKEKFSQPLERIILYIDDLDRCPEESVVQVLEAVNLLMAFPLFIVIVGVDPRWVRNALVKKHAIQFGGHSNNLSGNGREVLAPSDYLEKIFQVPFHLKEAKATSVKGMIKELANIKPKLDQKYETDEVTINRLDPPENEEAAEQPVTHTITAEERLVISEDSATVEELVELLVLTDEEVVMMQEMSDIIGNNPRAIKRFVNVFRIVKAHGELVADGASSDGELFVILFLLALPLGPYKKLLSPIEDFIGDEENSGQPITVFLQRIHNIVEVTTLSRMLSGALSDKPTYEIVKRTPSSLFLKHLPFIKRFAFDNSIND